MSEQKNYAEISFVNPILLDVFGNHMSNSVLASFVQQDGAMKFKLDVQPDIETPKNCEDVIGLLYSLLEKNSDLPVAEAYNAAKSEIMRETLFRLSQVLDGFGSIKITISTTQESPDEPDSKVEKHVEFTLNRTKSGSTVINQ